MNKNFDQKKAERQYEKAKNKAQELIDDPEKAKKVLNDAIKKADSAKGPLEKVWQDQLLMFGIVRDWFKGEYKEIPVGSIIAILGALIYFVSPIDLIPDFIPGVGYIDDVFILGLVISQIRADLNKYKLWKESKIA
ncbi:YkvA family protein [Desulfosporosinus sp. OT]|uniref:YkvA family protein n=1 Tax=Desulfosporosinus sp. OT TaxID=913865 RepID=UPI000223A641|nr:YkvA family protein [Desulfosporosinus sp. OT]EGW37785.1 hypothetical protein DOT_4314 [Desulfosporosinus sp. OT]